jgi:hypothetical protein
VEQAAQRNCCQLTIDRGVAYGSSETMINFKKYLSVQILDEIKKSGATIIINDKKIRHPGGSNPARQYGRHPFPIPPPMDNFVIDKGSKKLHASPFGVHQDDPRCTLFHLSLDYPS